MTSYYFAAEALLANNINSLPIKSNTIETVLKNKGWKIFYYDPNNDQNVVKLNQYGLYHYAVHRKGFSYFLNDVKIVFVHKKLSEREKTTVLAHELGHIHLQHFSTGGILGHHDNSELNNSQENEAVDFSRFFLAPICILKKLRIKSVEEVRSITLVDAQTAKIVFAEYINANRRFSGEEKLIIGNFKNYIDAHRSIKHQTMVWIIGLFLIVGVVGYGVNRLNTADSPIFVAPSAIAKPIPDSSAVWITKTGAVYHTDPDCYHIKGKDSLIEITVEEAKTHELEQCKDCEKQR